ncbi:hypothetical protein CEXT_383691 [Caerostris extrusa]|uniref:Uncharacterized protein n=1 Tax=Caerostris extrusa TaxID=172846 RepID=A0AAV4MTC0_CAEEX|nr:hypothetical protein CEXT_383691 [Caerostris extrusa]
MFSSHAVLSGEFSKDITPMAPGPSCEANQCSFSNLLFLLFLLDHSFVGPCRWTGDPVDNEPHISSVSRVSFLCLGREGSFLCRPLRRSVGRMISNDVVWMVTGQHDIDLTFWIGHTVGRRI